VSLATRPAAARDPSFFLAALSIFFVQWVGLLAPAKDATTHFDFPPMQNDLPSFVAFLAFFPLQAADLSPPSLVLTFRFHPEGKGT